MKKTIAVFAMVAMVGGVSADMYATLAVGYGIGNLDGTAGIVPDELGQVTELMVFSGGGDGLDAWNGSEWNLDLGVGNDTVIETIPYTLNTLGAFQDWATGYSVTIGGAGVAYDNDMWIVAVGSGLDGISNGDLAYVTEINSLVTDRVVGPTDPAEGLNFDAGGTGVNANTTVIAIPEPATFGLMGIAGLGMFLARKKARR